jgi:ATP-dependent Clp protease ATP-binding subunit ClpA
MALGWSDWDTLTAALRTVAPDQPGRRAPDDRGAPLEPAPERRTGTWFSPAMQASLHRAVALAAERKHGYTTLEHLLLALIEDKDAAAVMTACRVNLDALKAKLVDYIDTEYERLTQMGDPQNTPPTAGFHRAVQRAVFQVQTSGHREVTGANLLVAIFAERESHAFVFLQAQGMTQRDAVDFMAHGIRKGGAAA